LQVRAAELDPGASVPVPARAPDRLLSGSLVVAGTAAYAAWLTSSSARAPGWLVPAIIAVGVAVTGVIAWSLARRRPVQFDVALIASLVAVSLAPAVASASLAAHGESAFDTPFESARVQEVGAPYLMAAQSALVPSAVIYDSGLEALPIGGFDGTTPSPTLAQLQADIKQGRFHLVWIEAGSDPRLRWIMAHCSQISARFYDCAPVSTG
jgi:pimeloyl-ACP methyl ester carboxylesterase